MLLVAILAAVAGTRLAIEWSQSASWPIWATVLTVVALNCALYAPWYFWQKHRTPTGADTT